MNTKGGFSKSLSKAQDLCLNNFEYNANNIPKERGERREIYAEVTSVTTQDR